MFRRHCYGINLATGDAVGKLVKQCWYYRRQSIGGTWYSHYVPFHTGGVASNTEISHRVFHVSRKSFEECNPKGEAVITEVEGTVIEIEEDAATRTKKVFVQGKTGR